MLILATEPQTCLERIKTRNRACEQTIDLDYLKSLAKGHEDLAAEMLSNQWNVFKTGTGSSFFDFLQLQHVGLDIKLSAQYEDYCKQKKLQNMFL